MTVPSDQNMVLDPKTGSAPIELAHTYSNRIINLPLIHTDQGIRKKGEGEKKNYKSSLLRGTRVLKLRILIILLEQVPDNRARLPKRNPRVWILDSRNATVGIDADKRFLLHIREFDILGLVGDTEFLEDDGDFTRIGARGVGVEDDRLD